MQHQEPTQNPTAHKIMATARQLFMQRGYSAVSINDIVRAAAVTKPTLYYHFAEGKEELFVQMALELVATMAADMQRAIAEARGTEAQLLALAQVMLYSNDGDTRMMRREMAEHLSPKHQRRIGVAFYQQLYQPVVAVMQQGIDAGDLKGDNPHMLATLFMGVMEGFQRPDKPQPTLPEPLDGASIGASDLPAQTIVAMFLHGVGKQSRSIRAV
jgi:TetR/AcrR family transcriptional regulator